MHEHDYRSLMDKSDLNTQEAHALQEEISESTDVPEGYRTPTAEEFLAMKNFQKEFMKRHPKASERQIRRAIVRKFDLKIIKNK